MADEATVMVLDRKNNQLQEGEVTQISDRQFGFQVFNKFHLDQHPKVIMNFDEVGLIEFEGKELTLQTAAMGYLQTLTPVKKVAVSSLTDIATVLHQAEQTQQLISINPVADEGMFFVGRVNTIGENSVVINLVDMTGQFGGYWLVKLTAIAQVTVQSDYLAVMKTYINLDKALGVVSQPGLNDERLFDSNDDLFQEVLSQASKFQRVIRLQLDDDESVTGYISKFGGNEIIFHLVEQETVVDKVGTLIDLGEIDEVAFDYLDALLTEKQLRSQGEL